MVEEWLIKKTLKEVICAKLTHKKSYFTNQNLGFLEIEVYLEVRRV